MISVSVKELGLGYKAGDQLTWNAAALNGLPANNRCNRRCCSNIINI